MNNRFFDNLEFLPGVARWNHLSLDPTRAPKDQLHEDYDDLIFVEFPNGYKIDVSWEPRHTVDGEFIISLIENDDWDHPKVFSRLSRICQMRDMVELCVRIAKEK